MLLLWYSTNSLCSANLRQDLEGGQTSRTAAAAINIMEFLVGVKRFVLFLVSSGRK